MAVRRLQQQQQQPLFTLNSGRGKRKEEKKQNIENKLNNGRFIVIYIQVCEIVCSSANTKWLCNKVCIIRLFSGVLSVVFNAVFIQQHLSSHSRGVDPWEY